MYESYKYLQTKVIILCKMFIFFLLRSCLMLFISLCSVPHRTCNCHVLASNEVELGDNCVAFEYVTASIGD